MDTVAGRTALRKVDESYSLFDCNRNLVLNQTLNVGIRYYRRLCVTEKFTLSFVF